MASLKTLKKDIDFLFSEVISDGWAFIYLNPDKKTEDAVEIINDAVELRNNLVERVNNPDKTNIKKHYKAINEDLLKGVDSLFIRISNLNK